MSAPSSPLSISAQMRLKRAAGMSTGDIARLFGVSYHQAYSAVVTRRASEARLMQGVLTSAGGALSLSGVVRGAATPSVARRLVAAGPASLEKLSEAQLFELHSNRGTTKSQKEAWRAVRDELDRRDPSGEWLDRAMEYEAAGK